MCLVFKVKLEFGAALLEKNQTLEAEQEAVFQRLQAREEEIEHLREQIEELQKTNQLCKLQIVCTLK